MNGLFRIFIMLSMLDAGLTAYGLDQPGVVEHNPIANQWFELCGTTAGIISIKVAGLLFIGYCLHRTQKNPRLPLMMRVLNVGMVVVVVNNIQAIWG